MIACEIDSLVRNSRMSLTLRGTNSKMVEERVPHNITLSILNDDDHRNGEVRD